MAEIILTLDGQSDSLKFQDPLDLNSLIFLSLEFKQLEHFFSISTVQVGEEIKELAQLVTKIFKWLELLIKCRVVPQK